MSWLFSQTGYEIAERMSSREAPSDVKSTLIMTLKDKRGNTLESKLISHSKDSGKKQMIWFVSPPSDKGISLYKIENEDGKDLMKMWLPAFKKIRKISSRKKSENFMNSDLTFEDLYNRSVDDFTYDIDTSNDSIYVLSSYPKEKLNSSYSKHISWISRSTLLTTREESYSSKGTLLKTKEIKYTNIDGFDLVKEINVVDVKRKHETHLKFEDMVLNSGIKDKDFHEMNLKRLPLK
jgi:hypothetical protein